MSSADVMSYFREEKKFSFMGKRIVFIFQVTFFLFFCLYSRSGSGEKQDKREKIWNTEDKLYVQVCEWYETLASGMFRQFSSWSAVSLSWNDSRGSVGPGSFVCVQIDNSVVMLC